jgi:hypothetical protein
MFIHPPKNGIKIGIDPYPYMYIYICIYIYIYIYICIQHTPCPPAARALKDSRRRLISRLSQLRWIDERPVTAMERAGCEAWAVGGKEAEMEAAKPVGKPWGKPWGKKTTWKCLKNVKKAYKKRGFLWG